MPGSPRNFENDDEEAIWSALGKLNQAMHDAATRTAQDEAIRCIKAFLEHQRAKREYRHTLRLVTAPADEEGARDEQ
ncbi:hypothetical protein ACFSCW_03355 [Sphingomonas tabacisoli]|uniref:Uncharacterized protein n=1 Tax=Sphingomonas tabacisoli TaxID=2249466 RepID=A0ABW4I1B1_9SPHN